MIFNESLNALHINPLQGINHEIAPLYAGACVIEKFCHTGMIGQTLEKLVFQLFKPIFHTQALYTLKFTGVAGNNGQIMGKGDSGNQGIHTANWRTTLF